jgi:uncharacterized protein (TIGR03083 family)
MNQAEIVAGLRDERARLSEFLAGLAPEEWEKPSLCDGWRVKDVVAHLVGNVVDSLALRFDDVGSPEYNQRQVNERAQSSPAELLGEWSENAPKLEAALTAFDAEAWSAPFSGLPTGTLGDAVRRLLEDLWVHAQDIRIGLGATASPGPGLRATLESVTDLWPERASGLEGIGMIKVTAGDFSRSVRLGDGSELRISGDPMALALIATGRISLEDAGSKVAVEPEAPEELERALNIYAG